MGFGNALFFWVLYFAPTLIAWYRKRRGSPVAGSVGQLFTINLLLGWTVVGWILPLANAFGLNPVAWIAPRLVKAAPSGPGLPLRQTTPSSSATVSCSQCGGSGSMTCSSCGGRGSWYDAPTGATGVAQLHTCPACTSSGRIRCAYCGGSGRVPGPI
jgi:hypothetical protein